LPCGRQRYDVWDDTVVMYARGSYRGEKVTLFCGIVSSRVGAQRRLEPRNGEITDHLCGQRGNDV
jgi:hypothetical protein